jgi:hypothetical protein
MQGKSSFFRKEGGGMGFLIKESPKGFQGS